MSGEIGKQRVPQSGIEKRGGGSERLQLRILQQQTEDAS